MPDSLVIDFMLTPRYWVLLIVLTLVESAVLQAADWSYIRELILGPLLGNLISVPIALFALELLGPNVLGFTIAFTLAVVIDLAVLLAMDREYPKRAAAGALIGNGISWGLLLAILYIAAMAASSNRVNHHQMDTPVPEVPARPPAR